MAEYLYEEQTCDGRNALKKHIANWLSNISVATLVLAMFQSADTSLFGEHSQFAALAVSAGSFLCSILVLPKE